MGVSGKVGPAHGVTVHRRIIERRQPHRRSDRARGYPPPGFEKRDAFHLHHGPCCRDGLRSRHIDGQDLAGGADETRCFEGNGKRSHGQPYPDTAFR